MTTGLSDNPTLRRCLQKVATGPEYSKDLSFEEACAGGRAVLSDAPDLVQVAVFLIALRMKRETDDENAGMLQALLDHINPLTAPVETLVDIGEPYNGYTRCLPMSPFLPAVLAACDVPAVAHGLETVGPKYGATARKILRAAGKATDIDDATAAAQLGTAGWTYIDQSRFCATLHALVGLRNLMVKRSVLNTVEVLTGPIRARHSTHLLTGYVHKAYPPVYTRLAKQSGFASAAIVRGSEGGVMASLRQPAEMFEYHGDGKEHPRKIDPASAGIKQNVKTVPLPESLPAVSASDNIAVKVDADALAMAAAQTGLEALRGAPGPARDSLIYAGAIVLTHLKRHPSMAEAADQIRRVLDNGAALARFDAAA